MQAWLAANHSLEETQAEMARLQYLADSVVNIAEPKVTFRLIQVSQTCLLFLVYLSTRPKLCKIALLSGPLHEP